MNEKRLAFEAVRIFYEPFGLDAVWLTHLFASLLRGEAGGSKVVSRKIRKSWERDAERKIRKNDALLSLGGIS